MGEKSFQFPIELALDTRNSREIEQLYVDSMVTDFEFHTQYKPQKLVVDPNYEVLKIQKMPPRLGWFWDDYPKYILIYGTLAEANENKLAAEIFKEDYLRRLSEIIKADTFVSLGDLNNKCIILFGRPKTNKISQQFGDIFPIKFEEDKFNWQGITYDQPKGEFRP
ncbi:unnamed protein product, partial [marine sediment metagenome]